ncbi:MAG TPA: beta-ketoacyl-[acyl-carrier-protein] synthase family protein [Caulobacteraceae bacterium]|nr:beta-ketoacyl-[acyl-carrier-protein] synthase family protein [Caulobacteraceae bacterium]
MPRFQRRIVVTGMGAISALGLSAPATFEASLEGRGGILDHEFDPGPNGPAPVTMPCALAPGDVVAATEEALGRRIGGSVDLFSLFALKAAREALDQAGLVVDGDLGDRAAVVLGHGFAGIHSLETAYERFFGQRTFKVHPMTVPRVMVSAPASAVAMEFGIRGPVFATSSACASSGHAIAQGAALIDSDQAEVAVVGGAEAIATPACLRAWQALGAISAAPCRPFSSGRDGMTVGEGGGAMVLETLEHARARGARPIAELAGTGMSSDAFHWTQPSLEGACAAMRGALEGADVVDESELLISAHGTGTPLNDKNEAAALRAIFGERFRDHPVIATKSAHGHLIGAASVVQGVIGILALEARTAPPVLNYLGPDPDCDLELVLGAARPIGADVLLLNAFAFGGLNCSLVFRRWT